jgi:hypothetical protein
MRAAAVAALLLCAGVVACAPARNGPDEHDGDRAVAESRSLPDHPARPAARDARFDSDRDGVSDLDELRDGTDPRDPSDARAWHPEWTGHPRLLFDAGDVAAVRARCLEGPAPYPELCARARQVAAWTPPPNDGAAYDPARDEVRGTIAKLAAFVAVVEGVPEAAATARGLLLSIRTDVHTLPMTDVDQGTIHTSQALVGYTQAYDWLVGAGLLPEDERLRARWLLLELGRHTFRFYTHDCPFVLYFAVNNHQIKFAAALGLLGMLFNDEPDAAFFVGYGMTEVERVLLEFQDPPGGGQAEGPHYLAYSMLTYFSFLAAYHRFADGEAYPYRSSCAAHLPPCRETVGNVEDLWTSPRLTAVHRWWLDLRMPDGRGPNLDDARLHCAETGLMAASSRLPEANRVFLESPGCRLAVRESLLPETIVLHDPDLPAADRPGSPMRFLPEAGDAVLRSGWDADARYLLLRGEHGVARTHGLGHEQVDATSFLVAAFGESFLIDSGYAHFADREAVARAENHSLILVDGEGAPFGWQGFGVDVDAYLTDPVDDGVVQSATVTASYAGAAFTRRAVLVGGNVLATLDRIASPVDHVYTFLLHANAEGTTDGTLAPDADGAGITRPAASLRATIATTVGAPDYRVYEDVHGFIEDEERHAVLAADVSARAPSIVGVYVAAPAGADLPPTRAIRGASGVAAVRVDEEAWIDLFIVTDADREYLLAEEDTGLPMIVTDAEAVLVRFDRATGDLLYARVFGEGSIRLP